MAAHLDFETFSFCNLTTEGAYRYATDPSTEPLVASYKIDGKRGRWLPGDPYPFKGYDGPIFAWNAQFERLIWWYVMTRHGWPMVPLKRFYCVAAQARANALPGKLDNASRCLDIRRKKDMAGHRLMMKICVPKDGVRYEPTAAELEDLYTYCDRDVDAEEEIHGMLRPLSDQEWQVYHVAERINDEGVGVDLQFAKAAVQYADEERKFFADDLTELTGGAVTAHTQYARTKDWILPQLPPAAETMLVRYKDSEKKHSLDKAVRHNLLERDDEEAFLPPEVRQVVEIVDLAGRSSIAKYQAMIERHMPAAWTGCIDRVCGLYMPFGAGQTGRFSSVAVQVHNLMRDVLDDAPTAIKAFIENDQETLAELGEIIPMLSKLLRPTLIPGPGKLHGWGDWSAIEARVLPWLSGQPEAEPKLKMFRDGVDVYLENVASLGLRHRQEGKVVELSLGYGGGIGALKAMARGYGVHVNEDEGKSWVWGWRDRNPWAGRFWRNLHSAAMHAIDEPESVFEAGRVAYCYHPAVLNGLGALWCRLPSGRVLTYPGARIEPVETPWGEERPGITAIKGNWLPKQGDRDWPRMTLWHGLLCENPTQAVAADILFEALIRCLASKLTVCAHTHDEVLIESPKRRIERDVAKLQTIMTTPTSWGEGIPLDAEVSFGPRYKVKSPRRVGSAEGGVREEAPLLANPQVGMTDVGL